MKTAYRSLALLIAIAVVAQAAVIAFGLFGLEADVDDGQVITDDYEGNGGFGLHAIIGTIIIPLSALLLLLAAFFVKFEGAVKWAAIVFGLVVLQIVLAYTAFGVPFVGLLHGINAFLVAGAAANAAAKAKAASATDTTVATAP